MPAYGAQIIPNVPQVGDPKVPAVDHSVMDMIARTGTAGLAAFTNMAAMAQRGELEREQLAQRGALAQEELAFRREDSARDYSLARQQMGHQRSLADAARTFTTNRDTAIMGQATEFTNYLADSPHQPGTPEFYKYALKGVSKWPLAGKNPMAAQAWKEAADIHDSSSFSMEAAKAAAAAAGIDLNEAEASFAMGPKGPRVSFKGVKEKKGGKEQARIDYEAHMAAAKADEEWLKANPQEKSEKVPYKDSFKLEQARRKAGIPEATTDSKPTVVKMKSPNGSIGDVPEDQVEYYKSKGATLVTP